MNNMFTDGVKRVMQLAREESARLGHNYIGTEHLLLGIIKDGKGKAVTILTNLGLNLETVKSSVEDYVATSGGTMTIGEVPFTPRAKQILEVAANEAKEMKTQFVDVEHLLLALLKDKEGVAAQILAAFGVDYKSASEETLAVLEGKTTGRKEKGKKSKTPFLDHFGRDLTQLAREGKLDPVIGRLKEIERVTQILSRRKKNNPILIGDPGVGKTAIVGRPCPTHHRKARATNIARSPIGNTRYGWSRGRYEVSRSVRRTYQGGDERTAAECRRNHFHR